MQFRLLLIRLHSSTMANPTRARGLTSLPPSPRTFASVLRLDTVISQSPYSLRATRNSSGALKRETFYKTPETQPAYFYPVFWPRPGTAWARSEPEYTRNDQFAWMPCDGHFRSCRDFDLSTSQPTWKGGESQAWERRDFAARVAIVTREKMDDLRLMPWRAKAVNAEYPMPPDITPKDSVCCIGRT